MTKTYHTGSTAAHTPGPWDYDMDYIVAPDPDGRHPDIYIAEIAHSDDEGRIASPRQQDGNRRLIAAAPEMFTELMANERLLTEYVGWHHRRQKGCSVEWEDRLEATRDVIAKATGSSPAAQRKPIVIEVRGGIVQEVLNVPPGYEYEVVDYDNIETDGGAV